MVHLVMDKINWANLVQSGALSVWESIVLRDAVVIAAQLLQDDSLAVQAIVVNYGTRIVRDIKVAADNILAD